MSEVWPVIGSKIIEDQRNLRELQQYITTLLNITENYGTRHNITLLHIS